MINFTVPGKPQPKQRPRVTKKGTTYTPKETLLAEEKTRQAFSQSEFYSKPEPLEMIVWCFMPIPTSWSKKKKKQAIEDEILPTARPDVDNLAKLIMDALQGLPAERCCYTDDAQIVDLHIHKRYSEEPRTEIIIRGIKNV